MLSFIFLLLVLALMGQTVSGFPQIFNSLDFLLHITHFLIVCVLLDSQFRSFSPPCFGCDFLARFFQPFQKISGSVKSG